MAFEPENREKSKENINQVLTKKEKRDSESFSLLKREYDSLLDKHSKLSRYQQELLGENLELRKKYAQLINENFELRENKNNKDFKE